MDETSSERTLFRPFGACHDDRFDVRAVCHSINLSWASETRRATPHPLYWEAAVAHSFLITSSFKSI